MIWVPNNTDKHTQHLTENGVLTGTVRFMENNKKWMASTQKHYLGQYMSLKNAQTAVETKRNAECKTGGTIII